MPYKSPDQVPAWVPAASKKQFMKVWNSVFEKAKADGKSDKDAEQLAFAEATSVIKKEAKSMSAKREVRFLQNCEMRASEDGAQITGYAAVWDSPSEVMGGMFGGDFIEKVRRGAFSRALSQKQDVRALFNHDPSKVLGRTANGTLRLEEDSRGLRYEIDLPDTQQGRDLRELVKRGDVSQSSFSFRVFRDENKRGDIWREPESGPAERTLTDVDLLDVSPVTYPAYPETSVSARSLWPDGVPEEIEARAGKTGSGSDAENRTVVHMPGHKNSQGEDAPWVIKQEGTGKILGSFKTEEEAKQQLKTMEAKKHDEQKSLDLALEDIGRKIRAVKLAAKV